MTNITLKLRGPRLIDAADWMLDKPVAEEVDGEGLAVWSELGVTLEDGVLSIPAQHLANFIDEIEDGILIASDMLGDPFEGAEARAMVRALTTIAEKLRSLVNCQ